MAPIKLYTLGEIGRQLGQPLHRIRYAIESRGIDPHAVAGHFRCWTAEDVLRIKAEIEAIDAGKAVAL